MTISLPPAGPASGGEHVRAGPARPETPPDTTIDARGGGRPRKELGISDAEVARRYRDGQSIRQIAGSLGVYYNVIRYRLIVQGIQLRSRGGDWRTRAGRAARQEYRPMRGR
jgi:hypothetical protein